MLTGMRTRMSRSIKECLEAGEKVILDKETIKERLEVVKTVSLHMRLRKLKSDGTVDQVRGRYLKGGKAWTYEGRKLKIVHHFKGKPKWNFGLEEGFTFAELHDFAVDVHTNQIIASAKSL